VLRTHKIAARYQGSTQVHPSFDVSHTTVSDYDDSQATPSVGAWEFVGHRGGGSEVPIAVRA
jgi:hypothetical protein